MAAAAPPIITRVRDLQKSVKGKGNVFGRRRAKTAPEPVTSPFVDIRERRRMRDTRRVPSRGESVVEDVSSIEAPVATVIDPSTTAYRGRLRSVSPSPSARAAPPFPAPPAAAVTQRPRFEPVLETENEDEIEGLGRMYGGAMLQNDERLKRIVGGGLFDVFAKGLASVFTGNRKAMAEVAPKIIGEVAKKVITNPSSLSVAGVARPFVNKVVAPVVGATLGTKGKIAQKGLELLTSDETRDFLANKLAGRGQVPAAPKRKASAHITKRAALIKQLMRNEGLSMIEASKQIKARGLM